MTPLTLTALKHESGRRSDPPVRKDKSTFHKPTKKHLLDFSLQELETEIAKFSNEKYRARQICDWIFSQRISSFEKMTNLPSALRTALAEQYNLRTVRLLSKDKSNLDSTIKFTFQTPDQKKFSAVFLPHQEYNSLCISTQVGCAWKCGFCASGLVPFQRNLSSGEILDQIFWVESETNKKVRNVLFMGMGEPLANYTSTVKTILWLTSLKGFGMNPKRITLSTTGLSPQILKIAEEKLHVNLALSLHAPIDRIRKKIMPLSASFTVNQVLKACKVYQEKNSGDFTIEYILLKDVNDHIQNAQQLVKLIRLFSFAPLPKINLIPYNPIPSLPFQTPSHSQTKSFYEVLKQNCFIVHSRKPQGQDIDAACGQLL